MLAATEAAPRDWVTVGWLTNVAPVAAALGSGCGVALVSLARLEQRAASRRIHARFPRLPLSRQARALRGFALGLATGCCFGAAIEAVRRGYLVVQSQDGMDAASLGFPAPLLAVPLAGVIWGIARGRARVEDDLIRKVLGTFLKLKMIERNIFLNLDPRTPVFDKVSRARPLQGLAKEGMIVLPNKGPLQPKWLSLFEFCLRRFPKGAARDTIDAAAWVGQFLQDSAERWGRRQVFSMLGDIHLGSPPYKERFPIVCGITPPGDHPFYAVWTQKVRYMVSPL